MTVEISLIGLKLRYRYVCKMQGCQSGRAEVCYEGRVMSDFYNDVGFINSYVLCVTECFPASVGIDRNICLAYALGDAWSVGNIVDILDYRSWIEISDCDLYRCGFSELESYMTKEAFVYYIPALLISAMRNIGSELTRLHEVLLHMILPYDFEFSDLWDAFGDGLFDRPLDLNALRSIERCKYLHKHLNFRQSKCVVAFIENVFDYYGGSMNSNLIPLKRRFVGFWSGVDY